MKYLFFCLLIMLGVAPFNFQKPRPSLLNEVSFSKAIYDEHAQLLRLTLTADDKYRLYTPLSAIPNDMIKATLLKEDEDFYTHWGVDLFAIGSAFWQTYIVQGHRRGASTISMQVARLLYHINTHTLLGKIEQIFLALGLELHYTKDQILEAYFNLASYGNNIEGIAAASLIYYHQPVTDLKLPQILTLSIIPQNPIRRSLDQNHYEYLTNSRLELFKRWTQQFPQDKNLRSLMDLPLTNQTRQQLPFLAPHFVNNVLKKSHLNGDIETTLDQRLQSILEKNMTAYISHHSIRGFQNASAVLVDIRDMSVKALVGSANFYNTDIQGQVDGTLAKRSPGSTLKPFIYGLAIDQGLIHPESLLKDTPMHFGSYTPDNFDNQFLGPISAKSALNLSRNIPAIYLANQLKKPTFYEFLTQTGMSLAKEEQYGLALVLGGTEVSMQQLVQLYAMLKNEGIYHHLRFLKNEPLDEGKRLLSPEASFLVLDMLKDTPSRRHKSLPVSWKTGTSSGYRDAWTVGVFNHYVLAVWIGNFSGKANPNFIGADAAAPLFFNIIENLVHEIPIKSITKQTPTELNLKQVEICLPSGMLPTNACQRKGITWFIPGISPIKKDTIYREVMINTKTGLRACHFDPKNKIEVFEFWPSDIVKLFRLAGIQRRMPPSYGKECQLDDKVSQGEGPTIISPRQSYIYQVEPTKGTQIMLDAISDSDVEVLHWFIDSTYLGKSDRNQPMLWPAKPGQYTVRVVDNYGRADSVVVKIK